MASGPTVLIMLLTYLLQRLSGPMDYTPGIFQLNNFRYDSPETKNIDKGAIVPSTIGKELALYVVYTPYEGTQIYQNTTQSIWMLSHLIKMFQ